MKNLPKRWLDIILSSISLLIFSPLLLLLAAWIRIDSKGPIIFRQDRIGKDRKVFEILKLRTMVDRLTEEIDQNNETVIANGLDSRITKAGRFLRSTSLDELPQLWNILRGDMSIVGPRPIIPEQLEVVPEKYKKRFDVFPGLTGLAQIRGRRSLGWLQQLKADNEYAENYSLVYDAIIMLKTVIVVIKGSDIYGQETENWRAYRERIKTQESPNRCWNNIDEPQFKLDVDNSKSLYRPVR